MPPDVHGQRLDLHPVAGILAHLVKVPRLMLMADTQWPFSSSCRGGRLRVEVGLRKGGKAVVAAIAVQNINGVDGVKLMLLGIGAVSLGHARVKAAAQQGGEAGLSNFLA